MPSPRRYTCEDSLRRMDEYSRGRLAAEARELVDAHLRGCSQCRREYAFERSFDSEVRRKLKVFAVPPDMVQRVLSAVLTACLILVIGYWLLAAGH